MMAIDPNTGGVHSANDANTPDTQGYDCANTSDTQGYHSANAPDTQGYADEDFAAVEPDVEEAAHVGDQPTAAEGREIVSDGRAPPAGWRRNDFPQQGLVRHTVWTPPWSLRPPSLRAAAVAVSESED